MTFFGLCWNLRWVIELYYLERFWFLLEDFWKDGIFWVVLKLEISYRVILSWKILVFLRGFLKDDILGLCWNLRSVIELSYLERFWFLLEDFWKDDIFWVVLKLKINYRVIICGKILVSFRGFLERWYFVGCVETWDEL
jgi:hypothetical protein